MFTSRLSENFVLPSLRQKLCHKKKRLNFAKNAVLLSRLLQNETKKALSKLHFETPKKLV
jgi:hypothetical protein